MTPTARRQAVVVNPKGVHMRPSTRFVKLAGSFQSEIQVSGVQKVIRGSEAIDTGIFECTPGTYRRSVKQAEVMHFLSGRGRFTPDGEDTVDFSGGDTLFFEAHTEGTWEVEETMRKVYVIF